MRKAFLCAFLELRVYLRAGKIILPLLLLIGYPLIFYAIAPVDVVSSFALSATVAFAVSAWIGLSRAWGEEPILVQILWVKSGVLRFLWAQEIVTLLVCAACGAFLVAFPALWSLFRRGLFVRPLEARDALSALCAHLAASVAGGGFGGLFHPRLVRDRKIAYLACIFLSLLGLTGGIMGLPVPLRAALPPLYDLIARAGQADAFPRGYAPLLCAWCLLYGGAAALLRGRRLARRGF
jgi:hypothetical protein